MSIGLRIGPLYDAGFAAGKKACEAEIERLREALTMIANPDGLASRADNFGRFAEEYQRYAIEIARAALDDQQGESKP